MRGFASLDRAMQLLELLSPQTIKVPLEATDKQGAIDELIELLNAHGHIRDADLEVVRAAVWEREQQRSTGIGEGLAVPHGRCSAIDELAIAIGVPTQPVEFNAFDKKPVRMIVLLVSPPERTADHIQALGKVSRLMADRTFRESVYASPGAEALFALLSAADA